MVGEAFGLTDVEFKIFRKILEKGESALGHVIKELGLHKGTAYNSIRRLEEKGLVSFKEVDGINVYSVNIFSLKNQLEEEKSSFENKTNSIKEAIKIAESIKAEGETAKVNVLVGKEGFKTFFSDLYGWAYKTKEEYLFLGRGGEMIETFGMDYYQSTQTKKQRLGLKCRIILNEYARPVKDNIVVGDVRYLPDTYLMPTSTWIYGDKVVVVLWGSEPLLSIVIESKGAAGSYKSFFEALWNAVYSPKKIFESRLKVNMAEFISEAKDSLDICGICCIEPIHEGRAKIMELLRQGRKVRVLIANPDSDAFKKRVFLEEKHIKSIGKSRILFELKSTLANIKDIETTVGKDIEVRFFDSKPECSIVIVNNKKFLYNKYGEKPGEYGSSKKTFFVDSTMYPSEAEEIRTVFEKIWSSAKPISISIILQ